MRHRLWVLSPQRVCGSKSRSTLWERQQQGQDLGKAGIRRPSNGPRDTGGLASGDAAGGARWRMTGGW